MTRLSFESKSICDLRTTPSIHSFISRAPLVPYDWTLVRTLVPAVPPSLRSVTPGKMLAPAPRSDFRGGPRLRARQLLRAAPAALLFHALQPVSARTPPTGKAKAVTAESPRSSTTYADEPSNLPLQTPRERYLGRKLTYVGPGLRGWNKNQLMPSAEDVKDIHFLPFETEHDHATTSWLQTTDTMHLEREHEYLHDVKHWDKYCFFLMFSAS